MTTTRRTECAHCHRTLYLTARGLCSTCYYRLRESGELDALYPPKSQGRPIILRGCARCGETRNLRGRGLCRDCYQEAKRTGELRHYATAQERLGAEVREADKRALAERPHLAATLRQFRAARLRLEARKRNAERRWEAAA